MRTGELVDNLAKLEFIDEVNGTNSKHTHTVLFAWLMYKQMFLFHLGCDSCTVNEPLSQGTYLYIRW